MGKLLSESVDDMLLPFKRADWRQLGALVTRLTEEEGSEDSPPEGVDSEAWTLFRRACGFVLRLKKWYRFGESLRRRCPLLDVHEWGGAPLRMWLYDEEYREVFGDGDLEWPKLAGLLLVLHAVNPVRYPCLNELQMACFVAWDLQEVADWALTIAKRLSHARLEERVCKDWKRLNAAVHREDRYEPHRLVVSDRGDRAFRFSDGDF